LPVAPVLILFIAIVAANLAVMAIILVPPMVGRTSPLARDVVPSVDADRRAAEAAIVGGIEGSVADDGVSTRTYDRVVRVVSWVFLLTTSVIVAATGLWPETQPAIFVLLAFAGLFIVVVHELLPPDTLGPAKFVVEGSVAITVATLLVALTGGGASPFFFAFPLIVGGAALVVSPSITVGLAAAASIGYILAVLVGSPSGTLGPATSNVIIRAVGLDASVEIEHNTLPPEHNDIFLLCCDGLSDLVDDWMIREIMTSGDALEIGAENLIRAANNNGGTDNITVVLAQTFVDPLWIPPHAYPQQLHY